VAGRAAPNTARALQRALDDGAEGVAFDVEVTADGVLVAAEDRLVRALGLGARVRDVPWATLSGVDLAPAFGGGDEPLFVPAVAALLESIPEGVYVALCFPPDRDGRLVAAVEGFAPTRQRLWAVASDPALLAALARRCPSILRILRTDDIGPEGGAQLGSDPQLVRVSPLVADGLAVDAMRLPAHELAGLVVALGCDTAHAAAMAADRGIDVALTERPGWLRERFRKRRIASELEFPDPNRKLQLLPH
jgi:glycerophosphoryl diester phosphodiesterase